MAAAWGPPFHADHVGSLLRPQPLKDAFRDVHSGRIDRNAFRTIQDNCIRDAVAMQQEVGLQSITDGEFRRGSWFLGFVEAVEGLGVTDAPFEFHDGTGGTARFQTACVEAKLRRMGGITTDEFVAPCFTPPVVELMTTKEIAFHAVLPELGPDIIRDEFDEEGSAVRELPDGSYSMDGLTPIEEANRALGSGFESEDFGPVGGFVFGHLGRAPRAGDEVRVAWFREAGRRPRQALKAEVERLSSIIGRDLRLAISPA